MTGPLACHTDAELLAIIKRIGAEGGDKSIGEKMGWERLRRPPEGIQPFGNHRHG